VIGQGNGRHTVGEILLAVLLGAVAAVLAAFAGLVEAIAVGGWLLTGEAAAWSGLRYGPAAAAICSVVAFVLAFRWMLHYGNSSPDRG
jgi:hypothetical protein